MENENIENIEGGFIISGKLLKKILDGEGNIVIYVRDTQLPLKKNDILLTTYVKFQEVKNDLIKEI